METSSLHRPSVVRFVLLSFLRRETPISRATQGKRLSLVVSEACTDEERFEARTLESIREYSEEADVDGICTSSHLVEEHPNPTSIDASSNRK